MTKFEDSEITNAKRMTNMEGRLKKMARDINTLSDAPNYEGNGASMERFKHIMERGGASLLR